VPGVAGILGLVSPSSPVSKDISAPLRFGHALAKYVVFFLLGLLILAVAPARLDRVTSSLSRSPVRDVLIGLLGTVAMPVLTVLLAVTVVGILLIPVQAIAILVAGILGYTDIIYVGFAAHHLTEPNESLIVGTSKLPMKLTAHAGAAIPMGMRGKYGKPKSRLSPNVLYQQQAEFRQLNLGLYLDHGPITAGVWYRTRDAFIALIGFQTDKLKFGYSYDVTTSKLTTATAGSHEVSLQLQFNCKPKKRRFRVVACPTF